MDMIFKESITFPLKEAINNNNSFHKYVLNFPETIVAHDAFSNSSNE